jgi:hypothetical protein
MRLGLMKTSTVLSSISSQESLDGYDQYASCSGWLVKPEKLWEDAGTNIYEFLLPSSLLAPSRALWMLKEVSFPQNRITFRQYKVSRCIHFSERPQ